jgi:hypothetical protein
MGAAQGPVSALEDASMIHHLRRAMAPTDDTGNGEGQARWGSLALHRKG